MDYSSIINIEKTYFSDIHSQFDTFIKMIKSKDKVSEEVLKTIIVLNKKMQELSSDLEDLNYTLQKSEKRKTKKMKKNIKLYEENEKIIKDFLPYMIYYRFLLN
tara:strand:+ start:132 stop:443 length:312 start_codon:yes stop_codon:yes gene_type:complete